MNYWLSVASQYSYTAPAWVVHIDPEQGAVNAPYKQISKVPSPVQKNNSQDSLIDLQYICTRFDRLYLAKHDFFSKS